MRLEVIHMKNNTIVTIIFVVIAAGIGFYGGMRYQQSQTSPVGGMMQFGQGFARNQSGQNGQGRMGRGGATIGEVVSVDNNTITLQLQDGSSKIINLSSTTTYSKTDSASAGEVKKGTHIAVFGTSNSDGSMTAQNVQLNPQFRLGGRPSGQTTAH